MTLDVLLPLAADGLAVARASTQADVDRYLGVIERRVHSGHTGSRWILVVAQRDAQPGQRRAAAEQPDGGDGQPASAAARRSPSGPPASLDEGGSGSTTS